MKIKIRPMMTSFVINTGSQTLNRKFIYETQRIREKIESDQIFRMI